MRKLLKDLGGKEILNKHINLNKLSGNYKLSGVSHMLDSMSFVLDGITFTGVRDDCDGYRSYLEGNKLRVTMDLLDEDKYFAPVKVDASSDEDMLWLLNPKTSTLILQIGTSDACDYYPWYIATFNPENL